MKTRIALFALVLAGGAAAAFFFLATRTPGAGGPPAEMYAVQKPADGELPVLWQTPAFSFPDQTGATVTPASLEGHVWIADFIFTSCTTVCPTLTAKMAMLQRRLGAPAYRFVSFSVDPEHDTEEALAAYAKKWRPEETRWHLLRTRPDTLQAVARGMRVAVDRTDDPDNPILHSSVFLLVDARGGVRGVYNTQHAASLERLQADARSLADEASSPAPTVAGTDGGAVYASLGCAACHDDPKLAPSLHGILGRAVTLDDGTTLTADESYVRASILSPGTQVVRGFLPLMPSYAGQLSAPQLDALVAYVGGLEGDGRPAAAAEAEVATDPVCGMAVRVTDRTPSFAYEGRTYHFCSDFCRTEFAADPQKYLSGAAPKAMPMKGGMKGHDGMDGAMQGHMGPKTPSAN